MSIMKLKEYAFRLYIHIFSLKTYLTYQQRVQTELSRWLDTYEESRNVLRGKESLEEKKANQLLCSYHTMVTIMTDTCLSPRDETVFDSHTAQFVHLIRQLADLRGICPIHAPRGHLIIMSRSMVDMGCIPPHITWSLSVVPAESDSRLSGYLNLCFIGKDLGFENNSARFAESDGDRGKRLLQGH
jgi:hypothetical protein